MLERTIGELLQRAAATWPQAVALEFPPADSRRSFAQLASAARGRANAFRALGFSAGDHVGLLLPNSIDFVECFLGLLWAGIVAVPLNLRYRERELGYVIGHARLDGLIAGARLRDLAVELSSAPNLRRVIMLDDAAPLGSCVTVSREQLDALGSASGGSDLQPRGEDTAVLIYTSGTTSNPKGCLLSHQTLLRTSRAMARDRYDLSVSDRVWNPLPMFHMAAIHPLLACIDRGARFLSMAHFDAVVAVRQINAAGITILYAAFPTILADLLAAPERSEAAWSSIRRINCVAPPDTLRAMQARVPQAVLTSAYGLTEAGGVVAYNRADESLAQRTETCGLPFEGIEVRIVASAGEATEGAAGEIRLRGWCVFKGYFADPQASADAIDAQGWLKTGDIGKLDDSGRIIFLGRLKDVLRVGGENVSAVEVESVLSRHPAVKIAQVVGMPDARLGEVAVAFVEFHAERAPPDGELAAMQSELIAFCRERLASFKSPRRVFRIDEWPMSATKIQKFRLRERLHEFL